MQSLQRSQNLMELAKSSTALTTDNASFVFYQHPKTNPFHQQQSRQYVAAIAHLCSSSHASTHLLRYTHNQLLRSIRQSLQIWAELAARAGADDLQLLLSFQHRYGLRRPVDTVTPTLQDKSLSSHHVTDSHSDTFTDIALSVGQDAVMHPRYDDCGREGREGRERHESRERHKSRE
uniref:Transcription termination factor Rho n=1 Tax=Lygus hesperus TaxID=30085 RepID=A0A0A9YUG6_LYGHE